MRAKGPAAIRRPCLGDRAGGGRNPHMEVAVSVNLPDIKELVKEMEELRSQRRYAESDAIRIELTKAGYRVQNTRHGTYVTAYRRDNATE